MCIGMANGGKMMTPQEAITTLKREYLGDSEFMELAKQMGANALEKQIPKKVITKRITEDLKLYHCPCCDVHYFQVGMKYCSCCGQALDWSVEDVR